MQQTATPVPTDSAPPPGARPAKAKPASRAKRPPASTARPAAQPAASKAVSSTRQKRRPATAAAPREGKAMARTAQAVDLVADVANHTLAANPLIGLRAADVASAAGSLLQAVRKAPKKAGGHLLSYGKSLARIVKGDSEIAPHPRDKRFADPAWQGNFLLHRIMQGYLASNDELKRFIDESGLDSMAKGRAQFIAALVMDALSPNNNPLFNPLALRKIIDTGGQNLVTGVQQFVQDVRANKGLPSQVDSSGFKLGENIATAKGEVVFRNEMFELLQYAPTTAKVYGRPLVMSPPQINKYYAVDLSPEKSLIKWIQDSGVQLFVISWRNPTAEHRHWGLSEYVLCLDQAVEVAREITGSADVNMWGSCSGGMTLAAYLGWLAARNDIRKVANTSWAVCVLNTSASLDGTTLGLFTTTQTLHAARAQSRRNGVLTGEEMARMFAWMRPNDLIWNYWVNNYLLGNKPPAFDILAWNADTTNLPAQLHADYLDLVELNPFINPDSMQVAGEWIDMRKVKVGAYVIAGTTDHITPWKGCYGTARLLGEDSTFVLANAGHLQCFINPPGGKKSFYYAGTAKQGDPRKWLESAGEQREGSWWPHWRSWIQQRSGAEKDAPKKAGSRRHPALCAAPGTYVLE
ncbi:alpha/beta fold hydrolase [Pseudomonas sp. N040]|uniref:alpha/beta fold hydrolase n=1 Tax=Pseudomonas sp. N040 TaxID=2785325 RepID=UPI0018A28D63|nr:alpha/beta fold hydrolase [Pseudomonas sp. N040]MBF7729038.1 alpha/beta fold hydrolase [Pseudomonas sp. N040]MBW7012678.1 alpha/beta fold hydrolase [Pseudomonas sp. N040]